MPVEAGILGLAQSISPGKLRPRIVSYICIRRLPRFCMSYYGSSASSTLSDLVSWLQSVNILTGSNTTVHQYIWSPMQWNASTTCSNGNSSLDTKSAISSLPNVGSPSVLQATEKMDDAQPPPTSALLTTLMSAQRPRHIQNTTHRRHIARASFSGTYPPMWPRSVFGGIFVADMESVPRQEIADARDEAELIFVDV